MNILVAAAHPDDAEIGMGGSIAMLAQQGHSVLIADLTDGSPTPRGDRETRLAEAAAALAALQPKAGPALRRVMLDMPNRTLTHSVEARHRLAGVVRAHQASVMFVPHWEDAHPDHVAATRIAEDARFDAKLTKIEMPTPPGMAAGPPIYPRWVFYYDISHLRRMSKPDFCLAITGFERQKYASLRAYESQCGAGSAQPGQLVTADLPERSLAMAAMWGERVGTGYAEPFWIKEILGLNGLDILT